MPDNSTCIKVISDLLGEQSEYVYIVQRGPMRLGCRRSGMLKTFLVEDEVVIREMLKKMIPWEQYGFELAGEASDG